MVLLHPSHTMYTCACAVPALVSVALAIFLRIGIAGPVGPPDRPPYHILVSHPIRCVLAAVLHPLTSALAGAPLLSWPPPPFRLKAHFFGLVPSRELPSMAPRHSRSQVSD